MANAEMLMNSIKKAFEYQMKEFDKRLEEVEIEVDQHHDFTYGDKITGRLRFRVAEDIEDFTVYIIFKGDSVANYNFTETIKDVTYYKRKQEAKDMFEKTIVTESFGNASPSSLKTIEFEFDIPDGIPGTFYKNFRDPKTKSEDLDFFVATRHFMFAAFCSKGVEFLYSNQVPMMIIPKFDPKV